MGQPWKNEETEVEEEAATEEEAEMPVVVAEPPALIDQLKQQKVIAAKIREQENK